MANLQSSALAYFLRWRILARIRRFLRPTFRRPLPVFFVPNLFSVYEIPTTYQHYPCRRG